MDRIIVYEAIDPGSIPGGSTILFCRYGEICSGIFVHMMNDFGICVKNVSVEGK